MSDFRVTQDGWLTVLGRRFPCALGRSGVRAGKQEGDGATPAGRFALRAVYYRPDRRTAPRTGLPLAPLAPDWGWCDDPAHPDYNRRILLPHPARHERLWREDGLYDVLAVIGYNDTPVIEGKGSAIFLHVARPNLAPTEGCVALALGDLLAVLALAGPGDAIAIAG